MGRPVIGLTTYAEPSRFGRHDTFAAVLPMSYVRAVHASGGRAVLITPDDPDIDILNRIDGIILTGGADADPALYGEEPHPATTVTPERDLAEMLLLSTAIERDLPLLGICRGMQLMALAYGGWLHQHLPDVLGHCDHRPESSGSAIQHGRHLVRVAPGTRCHKILGDEVTVNSYHHQGVADPGRLVPAGWCPGDDLLEAVEDPNHSFAVGVQWHPEITSDWRVFAALVEAASALR